LKKKLKHPPQPYPKNAEDFDFPVGEYDPVTVENQFFE
jgi:hypothetical protein